METKLENKQTLVAIWSWPRSLSTVFAKFLSCVEDVQVWNEPYIVSFFMSHLPKADKSSDRPTTKFFLKIQQDMENLKNKSHEFSNSATLLPFSSFSYKFVKPKLEEAESGKSYIFFKDIVHAVMGRYEYLPDVPTRHTFLIRHPYRFLTSLKKLYMKKANYQGKPEDFDLLELSSNLLRSQYELDSMYTLWKFVRESGRDPNPIIIDAEDVSRYPEKVLPKYFAELGIPFDEKYLTWDSSLDPIKRWKGAKEQVAVNYENGFFRRAFDSSCFTASPRPTPKREEIDPDIIRIADFILPGYEEMCQRRIKPE